MRICLYEFWLLDLFVVKIASWKTGDAMENHWSVREAARLPNFYFLTSCEFEKR
jgi:hypothetical protein